MFNAKHLIEKWDAVLNHQDLPAIQDAYRQSVTSVLLENQEKFLKEAAPVNNTAGVDNWDPILISLIRQAMPNLMAYDIAGVQPMTGPTGLIFAMKSKYSTQGGTQALFNEADTDFSGTGTHAGTNPSVLNDVDEMGDPAPGTYTAGTGIATADAEDLGRSGGGTWGEMAFSIDKISVTAKSRALKAEYSLELEQDLKAIHGLDAFNELANILSAEILAEINREFVRTVYNIAVKGAQNNVTNAGIFDLDADTSGRWSLEKFKMLLFQIERDANAIAQQTRRGKGNTLIVPADLASALVMTGMLDYAPALQNQSTLQVDDTGNTFAGVLLGRYRVYVDPYAANISDSHFYVVGYKGRSPWDAGLFYCPYVPLQLLRATDSNSMSPVIGFKTRYGLVANPHVSATGAVSANSNAYYRRVKVTNLVGAGS